MAVDLELVERIHRAGRSIRPLVMGVLNLTPDSFSDGGRYTEADAAERAAREMARDGADLLDLGAESTRPGAEPVSEAEQISRLRPLLERLRGRHPAPITVDTTRAGVAELALDLGAVGINDISAGRDDPEMLTLAARRRCLLVLMHMQGTPATMQQNPVYSDVVAEVGAFLGHRVRAAVEAGVETSHLLADPGIGFGKTLEHNLELLRNLGRLRHLASAPLLVGTSRKGFLGLLTGRTDPAQRSHATTASVAWSAANGAAVLRVHEVAAARDAVAVAFALASGR